MYRVVKRPTGRLACGLTMIRLLLVCLAAPLCLAEPPATPRFDNPCWSPDGKWIAFSDGARDALYVYDTAEKTTLKIAESPSGGYACTWSPGATRIGFKVLTSARLQIPAYYDLAARRLVTLHAPVKQAGVPSFAADGRIVFTVGPDLQVVDASGHPLRTVPLGHYANLTPIGPDGRNVAYNDKHDQIRTIDLDTGVDRELTSDAVGYFNPIWSPDSARLIVSTMAGRLKTIELATGKVHDLGPGNNPSWSGDGNTVVYTMIDRTEGGRVNRADICQARYDGTEVVNLSPGGEHQSTAAHIARDGRRIAFVSLADGEVYEAPTTALQPTGQGQSGLKSLARSVARATIGSATKISGNAIGLQSTESTPAITAMAMESGEVAPAEANQVIVNRAVPYIHQVYDTPNSFNGHWACGATSAMMCISYYDILPTWDVTVSSPYSHVSHYGQYVSAIYSYNGHTYNIAGDDPNGNPAYGGYGYIIQGDWEDTRGHMRDYLINHGLSSSVDWSPTWSELQADINAQHPFVVLNMLTTSGHYITAIGYFTDKQTAIFNDPYGNKNTPGYPSYDGAGACYDWPGQNNGYVNLNTVSCFIYARGTVPDTYIVESRLNGQNYSQYSDSLVGTDWANADNKSTAAGLTSEIGARYGSTYRSRAGEKHATFKANLTQAGTYEVFVTWGTRSDRRSPILHRITHSGGTADVNVDQAATANAWVSLGTYTFAAGTNVGQVDVSNLNIDVSGSMLADAVKWELRTPLNPPTITQHPSGASACAGGTVTLTVAATGTGTLTYQWQKDGTALTEGGHYAGTTTPGLTITSMDATVPGPYRCVVSNAAGGTPSNAATVALRTASSITQQPSPRTATLGGTAQFTIVAAGDGTIGYQWQRDGVNLNDVGHFSGTTSSTLTVSACTGQDMDDYACVVTAGCGVITSNAAHLTVTPIVKPDLDVDGDVDATDFAMFWPCLGAPGAPPSTGCENLSMDQDADVDQADFGIFQRCLSGATSIANPNCDD